MRRVTVSRVHPPFSELLGQPVQYGEDRGAPLFLRQGKHSSCWHAHHWQFFPH